MRDQGRSAADIWSSDLDLEDRVKDHAAKVRHARGWALVALAYGTCGVVYGDVGTSPLYVFGSIFPDGAPDDANRILGAFAMIFWSITTVVMVKYIVVVLRADDNGEGGTFALYANICRAANIRVHVTDLGLSKFAMGVAEGDGSPRRRLAALVREALATRPGLQLALLLGVMLSACMVLSDGVLTPAISVISAIEGLQYNTGISKGAVVGITCAILIGLFILQTRGTEGVSFLFSPFILAWLLANGGIGVYNIIKYDPTALRGLSPHYIYYYWAGQSTWAWQNLGHVMLAITGTEALFADMGHFSAWAIRLSFICLVYPCLVLTYLGQAAFIIQSPESASVAFWASQPAPLKWPMVVLATLAAIIASQALISGAFSIVQQAVAISAFPRVRIKHTSHHVRGQVFIPTINWFLMIACTAVVLIFQGSNKIGNAYGLAVNIVECATTFLVSLLALIGWEWHPALVATFWLTYAFIEFAFLSSNMSKIPKGAWFPLVLSLALAAISYTWHWGQELKLRYIRTHSVPLRQLLWCEELPTPQSPPQDPRPRLAAATAAADDGYDTVRSGTAALGGVSVASLGSKSNAGSEKSAEKEGGGGGVALRLGQGGPLLARVPGVGIYYNELLTGVPPVLVRFLQRIPALHQLAVFLTLRSVPLPHVEPKERLLVRKLWLPGFFHVVVRYGYMDTVCHDHAFVEDVLQEIVEYLSPGMGFEEDAFTEGASRHGSYLSRTSWHPPTDANPAAYPTVAVTEAGSMWGTVHSYHGRIMGAALQGDLEAGTFHSADGRDLAASMFHRSTRVTLPVMPSQGDGSPGPRQAINFTYITPDIRQGSEGEMPWVQQPSAFRRRRNLAMQRGYPPSSAAGAADEVIFGAMSMPLPAPPPRPSMRAALSLRQNSPAFASLAAAGADDDIVHGPRTVPLPPAPPRPGLLHRALFLSRSSADAAQARRRLLEPTIFEDGVTQEVPALQAMGAAGPSEMLPLMPRPPEDPANEASLTMGSGAGGDTSSSRKQRVRPQLPSWWTKKGKGTASPDNSLSPAELKVLAKELAAKLAEERRPTQSEDADLEKGDLEKDLEAREVGGDGKAVTIELAEASAATPAAAVATAAPSMPAGTPRSVSDGQAPSLLSPGGRAPLSPLGILQRPPSSNSGSARGPTAAAAEVARRDVFNLNSMATHVDSAVGGSTRQRGAGGVSMEEERAAVEEARAGPRAYLLGKSQLQAAAGSMWFKVLVLESFYSVLAHNTHSTPASYHIPSEDMVELGVTYEV